MGENIDCVSLLSFMGHTVMSGVCSMERCAEIAFSVPQNAENEHQQTHKEQIQKRHILKR